MSGDIKKSGDGKLALGALRLCPIDSKALEALKNAMSGKRELDKEARRKKAKPKPPIQNKARA